MSTARAAGPAGARPLVALGCPLGPPVLQRLLPAVAAALEGGPAVLALPEEPVALHDRLVAAFRPSLPVDDGDPGDPVALVVPTSGTTGEPKGALLGAHALLASAAAAHARLAGPGQWLLALPASSIGGLQVIVRSVVSGRHPVAMDLRGGFDPEAFAASSMRVLSTRGPHYTSLVPTQLRRLLDAGSAALAALAAYDAVLVGGAGTPAVLLERARESQVAVVPTYGMTETSGGCVYDGEPLDGVDVQITPDGLVRLSGPVLAQGYRLRPDLTAAAFRDGWFTTADLGRIGPDRRLEVLGRADEVALSGGVTVPLAAVDEAVLAHPAVAQAAAVALPDAEWGQRVVVAVVPSHHDAPPTLESVRAFVARRAPAAYSPREIVVVDAIPTIGNAKIDRRALAASLLRRAEGRR